MGFSFFFSLKKIFESQKKTTYFAIHTSHFAIFRKYQELILNNRSELNKYMDKNKILLQTET